ncbi:hypothetical protein N2W54_004032 [Lotmaria passim]
MRPSFRLGGAVAAVSPSSPHEPNSSADVVCELSPMQLSLPPPPPPPPPPSPPVEERLLQYGRVYAERLLEAQSLRRLETEAAAAAAMKPASPLQPRRLFAATPSFHATAEVARRHRADRHAAFLSEREAGLTRQPAILPTSRDMAHAVRQREKLEGLSVAERLQSQQKTHDTRMEEKRREEAARLPFKPAVSTHTKRLKVSAPVVERLYVPRTATTSIDSRRSGTVLANVTNRHGTTAANKPASASATTYQRLYYDAVTRRTQSEIQDKLTQVRSGTAFRPTINPVSDLIASQSNDTAQARLLRAKAPPDATRHVNPEETFAPRINPVAAASTTIAHPSHTSLSTRSEMWLRRRRAHLRRVVAERHDVEMRECTFHPRTNRGPASGSPWGISDDTVTSRSSSDTLIESAEELLSHLHLGDAVPLEEEEHGGRQRASPRQWADALRSTMPDDILVLLEEVESASRNSLQSSLE